MGGDGTINEVANGFFEEISLGNSSGDDQTTLASPILKPINPGAVMALVATLPTYESNLCNFSVDDGRENILTKMTMGAVANGRYLGGGFQSSTAGKHFRRLTRHNYT